MTLTEDEIEQAAQRLCNTSNLVWDNLPELKKSAMRQLVTDLATIITVPHSEEAVAVFMAWMGDREA